MKKKKMPGKKSVRKKPFITDRALLKALVFIIFVLIAYVVYSSLAGVPSADPYEYNGYEFELSPDGFWKIPLQAWYGERDFFFYNHPSDLEHYEYDPRVNSYLAVVHRNRGEVIIALDPEYANETTGSMASVEVAKVTSQVFGMKTSAAYTEPIPGDDDLPIANCDNASEEVFVLNIKLNGDNSVGMHQDFCAALYAETPRDAIKLASLFVYKNLGVMR